MGHVAITSSAVNQSSMPGLPMMRSRGTCTQKQIRCKIRCKIRYKIRYKIWREGCR
jgi:hypothetical protein